MSPELYFLRELTKGRLCHLVESVSTNQCARIFSGFQLYAVTYESGRGGFHQIGGAFAVSDLERFQSRTPSQSEVLRAKVDNFLGSLDQHERIMNRGYIHRAPTRIYGKRRWRRIKSWQVFKEPTETASVP